MPTLKNITGQRFGRLVALWRFGTTNGGDAVWLCRCDCGKEKPIIGYHLPTGHTRSCGCLLIEDRKKRRLTHGEKTNRRVTPEYNIWVAMTQRCRNPNSADFKNYGGRGIQVCERWNSFENFLADVGRRPHPNLTIDRIQNDGDYEPGNIRWATRHEQNNNQRPRKDRKRL